MAEDTPSTLIPSKDDVFKVIIIDLIVILKTKIALANGTYLYSLEEEWTKELAKKSLPEIESELIEKGIIDNSLGSLAEKLRSVINFMNNSVSLK